MIYFLLLSKAKPQNLKKEKTKKKHRNEAKIKSIELYQIRVLVCQVCVSLQTKN